ncbi:carbohydrate kinase [Tersicoccus solisilvae]|uniref:Carbohydrate kinase n=1 Tax=Tersicoccus solisilvae TaxID=1882339 RepID=A0ABQ1PFN8_9MICC|nr:sugar kinase [Tersicoccus solisilvae]GGC96324.1 carbohydrate kinase [Tersicoccus solisilvae]
MPTAVCLGETMAVLTPGSGRTLSDADELRIGVGGAESNVALGLAALGVDAHWVSRVGRDGFGDRILRHLAGQGVGVGAVGIDDERPTGLYVKVPSADPERTPGRVLYYRRGSAAAALGPDLLDDPAVADLLDRADLIHLSGITAALSDDCRALVERLLGRPRDTPRGRQRISFDVNWRPALWTGRHPEVLRALADRADVVLVGADEAEAAFGTTTEAGLRRLLPSPEVVVVKDGAVRASALARDGSGTRVPALTVATVEPVGAGDAFAAGYLGGLLLGRPEHERLRAGHVAAAATLTVRADRGVLPEKGVRDRLLGCSDEDWSRTAATADGFAVDGVPVRTNPAADDHPHAVEPRVRS